MLLLCPTCHKTIEVGEETPPTACSSCGAPYVQFHGETITTIRDGSDETHTYVAAKRPASDSQGAGTGLTCFGDYELLHEIARGGMGVVFKARQISLNRIVALKTIRSGELAGEHEIQRFHAESEAVAQLDHPNIVPIYEVGEAAGLHFFSMCFIEGRGLDARLKDGPLPPKEAAQLVHTIAEAIQYAHDKGIVHRDLKPANVLIDGDGTPRITDFGLAKNIAGDSGMTATGQVLGTPSYMSPEQATGRTEEISSLADVYSLGAMLYALVTGRPPFQAANVMETLKQVCEAEPVPPRQLNPAVDRDLETISLKCLQKDSAKRYSSASELSQDLRHFLNDEPIRARPVSWAERSWRWTKRHPARAGLATFGLVAAIAVAGLGVALNYQRKLQGKNEQLQKANHEVSTTRDQLKLKNEQLSLSLNKEKTLRSQLSAKNEEVEQLLNLRRVHLAMEEWKDNEVPRAMALLGDCPPKRRHWEWYYVKRLCESHLLAFRNHEATVSSVAISPDGKRILSGDTDGDVKLWDAATGRELLTLPPHQGSVFEVTFSEDGTRFATSAADSVRVWDGKNGRVICQLSSGSRSVSLSSSGERVAALHQFRTVKVWDVTSGREIVSLKQQPRGIGGVTLSPDGTKLATVTTSGVQTTAHLWDAQTGERRATFAGHDDYVNAVAFSPDGKRIATAGKDHVLKIWDADSGRELRTLRGHQDSVEDVAFRRDGRKVVSCSRDKSVKVWDTETGLADLTLRGHGDIVVSVGYSPDGQRTVSGSWDKTVRLWDATRRQTMLVPDTRNQTHSAAAWTPDGRQFVTTSPDLQVEFRDSMSGRLLRSIQPTTGPIRQLALSSDGKRFATLSSDGLVRVWDQDLRRPLLEVRERPTGWAFSSKGDRIGLALGEELRVLDAANGRVVSTYRGHNNRVFHMAFSPDGRRVVSASRAAISPSGKTKLWDETVKVWDAESGREQLTLKGNRTDEVSDLTFSQDGKRIATANWDGAARVWDAQSGQPLLVLRGHAGFVNGVAFSPDGMRIATVGDDGTLRIWLANSGREALTLKDNRLAEVDVAFSPDGRLIMTRGSRVHIRDAAFSFAPVSE